MNEAAAITARRVTGMALVLREAACVRQGRIHRLSIHRGHAAVHERQAATGVYARNLGCSQFGGVAAFSLGCITLSDRETGMYRRTVLRIAGGVGLSSLASQVMAKEKPVLANAHHTN